MDATKIDPTQQDLLAGDLVQARESQATSPGEAEKDKKAEKPTSPGNIQPHQCPLPLGPLEYAVVVDIVSPEKPDEGPIAVLRGRTGRLHRQRLDSIQRIGRKGQIVDTREQPLREGVRVERGPHWCYGRQDGWPGTVGTVVRISPIQSQSSTTTLTTSTTTSATSTSTSTTILATPPVPPPPPPMPTQQAKVKPSTNTRTSASSASSSTQVASSPATPNTDARLSDPGPGWTLAEFPGGVLRRYRTGAYGKFDLVFATSGPLLSRPIHGWAGFNKSFAPGDLVLLADPAALQESSDADQLDPLGLRFHPHVFGRVAQVADASSSIDKAVATSAAVSHSNNPQGNGGSGSNLVGGSGTAVTDRFFSHLDPGFVAVIGGKDGLSVAVYPAGLLVHAPQGRQVVTLAGVRKGFRVVRHPGEWKSNHEDGGSGNIGTIVDVDASVDAQGRGGKVAVKWKGEPVWHAIGKDDVHELQYAESPYETVSWTPSSDLPGALLSSSSSSSGKPSLATIGAGAVSVGDLVYLADDYEQYADARSGPLTPGSVGRIVQIEQSSRQPYYVEHDKRKYWYMGQALIRLPQEPINEDNSTPNTRVMRGADWKWQEQDGGFGKTGFIVGPSSRGWVNVEWSSGTRNSYRAGGEGKHDLIRAPDKPRGDNSGRMPEGTLVVLSAGFESCSDAAQGPLKPGDVGVISKDDGSSKPYQVKAESGATWWYDPKAIEQAPPGTVPPPSLLAGLSPAALALASAAAATPTSGRRAQPASAPSAAAASAAVSGARVTAANAAKDARVRRGRDWMWDDQDGYGIGRLTGSKDSGWWEVLWETGGRNSYRVGADGAYDLVFA